MTLNQIIKRIKTLVLAHKQVRMFKTGLIQDYFADHTSKYPACCLQYTGGTVSITGGATLISFRMYLLDMVHVSEDTKENEDDVLSDMLSIILDLVAEINNSNYQDWKISLDSSLTALVEYENDLTAGWFIDFTIATPYTQDLCQVPTDLVIIPPTDTDMKLVYDVEYIATGTEGNTIDTSVLIPEIKGKKILFATRESAPLYKVNINPDSEEYTWNDTVITLGAITNPRERFLFLYRTY